MKTEKSKIRTLAIMLALPLAGAGSLILQKADERLDEKRLEKKVIENEYAIPSKIELTMEDFNKNKEEETYLKYGLKTYELKLDSIGELYLNKY